jgi:SAM-dependent methyltransferase
MAEMGQEPFPPGKTYFDVYWSKFTREDMRELIEKWGHYCTVLQKDWFGCQKGRLLDFGCGLGIKSVLFAEAGYEVLAMDCADSGFNNLLNWFGPFDGCTFLKQKKPLHRVELSGSFDIIFIEGFFWDLPEVIKFSNPFSQEESRLFFYDLTGLLSSGGRVVITFDAPELSNSEYKMKAEKIMTGFLCDCAPELSVRMSEFIYRGTPRFIVQMEKQLAV